MMWLAWRQFRTQAVVAVGGLAVVAVTLAITGPHLVHLYDTTVATCSAHGDCSSATAAFLNTDPTLQNWLDLLVGVVPGLIGIFWGAPLIARELETGTFRLAWTQSVTRGRWLLAKLGLVGLASMITAGLLSLMVSWWFSPIDRVSMIRFSTFDQRAIVPIAYAAFAFALGVTLGLLIRRTLPAMATTLVAFVAVRLVEANWVRPHLFVPIHRDIALDPGTMSFISHNGGAAMLVPSVPSIPNAWIISAQIVDRVGHGLTAQIVSNTCPSLATELSGPPAGGGPIGPAPPAMRKALHDCVVKVGTTYHQVLTYQPASRYWAFQWYEGAIFLALALALCGSCFWWVRRRLT